MDIDVIEARANAASTGPWLQPIEDEKRAIVSAAHPVDSLLSIDRDGMAILAREEDADFIVAARSDVPALCAEVRRLRALISTSAAEEREACAKLAEDGKEESAYYYGSHIASDIRARKSTP